MNKLKTRQIKVIGALYIGNKQYPLVRQEHTVGILANISTWTVIDVTTIREDVTPDDGEIYYYARPITITTTMPWLIEYHPTDKFVNVLDDDGKD